MSTLDVATRLKEKGLVSVYIRLAVMMGALDCSNVKVTRSDLMVTLSGLKQSPVMSMSLEIERLEAHLYENIFDENPGMVPSFKETAYVAGRKRLRTTLMDIMRVIEDVA